MYSQLCVFFNKLCGELVYSSWDSKNPRSPFAIVHSFGLSGGFRSSCWPNMSTILRGVQNSRTCGEFQRLLYAKMFQSISSWITSGLSLLILAAVSIDRLLALTYHLRYNTIVTVPLVFQTVFALCLFSITAVMLRFWITTTLSTFKIFQIVRRHQRQINDQNAAVSHL